MLPKNFIASEWMNVNQLKTLYPHVDYDSKRIESQILLISDKTSALAWEIRAKRSGSPNYFIYVQGSKSLFNRWLRSNPLNLPIKEIIHETRIHVFFTWPNAMYVVLQATFRYFDDAIIYAAEYQEQNPRMIITVVEE